MKEVVTCVGTIFIRMFEMQLLVKNSDVKESLMQTELLHSRFISRGKIFTNFTNQWPFVKVLSSKYFCCKRVKNIMSKG